MLGPICIEKAAATEMLRDIADGPDALDILVTSQDVVHTACANRRQAISAVPVRARSSGYRG